MREHSVCTNCVSNFRCSPVDAHIPVSPVVTGTVHPTRSADSQEFCRSVMENSEPSASKSDLGLGIIDTACLFCVAGSDWWANYKSLLEDFGLNHEIDETREAERYKFGDSVLSSYRSRQLVLRSQGWNKVFTTCMDHLDLRLVHTHVDDFLSALKKASKKHKDALQHLVHELHLKQQSGLVVYCGRTICRDGNLECMCGLVCCLTHSPELLKTERFDLSTIISWQSSTIKRVVRSTLAAGIRCD